MKKRKSKKGIIKEYVFLFIGLLLLISLFICIYLVNLYRKYIHTTATIVDVVEVEDTNKVTLNYSVAGDVYDYEVSYDGEVIVGDKVDLYYFREDVKIAKLSKTNKLIFVCPLIGFVLCVMGIVEIMRKKKMDSDKEEELYKTKVISVLGETQMLKIITDGENPVDYRKSMEESNEVPVKAIKGKNRIEIIDDDKVVFEKSNRKKRRRQNTDRKKVIPNYYYISNGALVYEEFGKGICEVDFQDINRVVKTLNKHGNVVKLVVYAKNVEYVLTNLGQCDIEVTANLLHNKIIAIDENFIFEVENKNY